MKKTSVISIVLSLVLIFSSFTCYAEEAPTTETVLRTARNTLAFSVMSDEDISSVTNDLYLPAHWADTDIYWTSNNETLLHVDGETGVVSRPPFGDGRACVILSANMVYENQSVTKNFFVRIKEESIGRESSSIVTKARDDFDREFLSNQNVLAIRDNLVLPEINTAGITVSYVSENPEVISSEGIITRSMYEDKIVNFVVNFHYGYEITRLSYALVVKAMNSDEVDIMLEEDLAWIISELQDNHKLNKLTENLSLPQSAPNGSEITYSSSDTDVLGDNGKIKPSDSPENVDLTITVSIRGMELSSSISIRVLAKNEYNGAGGGSGGSFGGSQPVNSASGNTVTMIDKLGSDTKVFNDVENSHWASSAIRGLKDKNLISGDGSGNFRPNDYLTREELVKMVVLSAGAFITDGYGEFTDVPFNHWSYYYINSAYSQGLISGRGDGTFGIGENVTRQDAAVIIYNTLIHMKHNVSGNNNITFADAENISAYALKAIAELQNTGIINGKGDNMFMPLDNLTRAEGAAIIWRMLQK